MDDENVLILLKIDIGILSMSEEKKTQLEQYIQAAKQMMKREGVELTTPYSAEDAQLIVMYAAYLYRKRDTADGMPRMLRWALNNRILSQKVGESHEAG